MMHVSLGYFLQDAYVSVWYNLHTLHVSIGTIPAHSHHIITCTCVYGLTSRHTVMACTYIYFVYIVYAQAAMQQSACTLNPTTNTLNQVHLNHEKALNQHEKRFTEARRGDERLLHHVCSPKP